MCYSSREFASKKQSQASSSSTGQMATKEGSRQRQPRALLLLPRNQSGAEQSFRRGEEASAVVETRLSQEWKDCSMFKDMSLE